MKTLIIYDDSGYIYLQITGSYRTPEGGLNFLEVDFATIEDKIVKSVDIETKTLVLEDKPKTEIEQLKEQIANLELANAELTTLVAMGQVG